MSVLWMAVALWARGHLAGVAPPFASAWKLRDGAQFEYIVVGAGAAGCAAAARLARGGARVLLLEAGPHPGLLSKIPNAVMALQGTDIDWYYGTVPNDKSCLSSRGRQCRFRRGRCLGGSTSINYMLYTRGNRHDYDFNITGWSWKDLERYFLHSEGLQDLDDLPTSSYPYHNTMGPVKIGYFDNPDNPWHKRILIGLMSLNFPYNPDVNAKSQIGVTQVLGYVYRGERVTAATAYLNVKFVNSRLKVASNLRCTGVIFDEDNVARGVTVARDKYNRTMKFYAKEEVILSAGTVGSAQLLMLSGIGSSDHLKKLGIPVRVDVPVGNNMRDHVLPIMIIRLGQESMLTPDLSFLQNAGFDAIRWLTTQSGPFASIGVTDIVGFANTHCYDFMSRNLNNSGPECELPNLQILFSYIDRYAVNLAPFILMNAFDKEVSDQIIAANWDSPLLIVSPILLQPKSIGWIRLKSADPLASPVITPNYLDDEEDVKELVKSIAIIEHLVQTPVFGQYDASILRLNLRDCPDVDEDDYWKCYVRHMTNSVYHAVGTAALGTVVDEKLRVRGVKKLRIGDLSILPKIPRGNTAAVAMAIGERLAEFLREDKF